MYLMNRKMIFGERYHPKKNFVSSKIKFSFLFGSFGALLDLLDLTWDLDLDLSLTIYMYVELDRGFKSG